MAGQPFFGADRRDCPGRHRRPAAHVAAAFLLCLILPGCSPAQDAPVEQGGTAMTEIHSENTGDLLMVEGRLISRGNAVDCPQIQLDDGRTQPVFGLDASHAIGERLQISGRTGISTRCRGQVLIAEQILRLTD